MACSATLIGGSWVHRWAPPSARLTCLSRREAPRGQTNYPHVATTTRVHATSSRRIELALRKSSQRSLDPADLIACRHMIDSTRISRAYSAHAGLHRLIDLSALQLDHARRTIDSAEDKPPSVCWSGLAPPMSCLSARTHTHTLTYAHPHMFPRTRTPAHSFSHTRTLAHALSHTSTHTHTQMTGTHPATVPTRPCYKSHLLLPRTILSFFLLMDPLAISSTVIEHGCKSKPE